MITCYLSFYLRVYYFSFFAIGVRFSIKINASKKEVSFFYIEILI